MTSAASKITSLFVMQNLNSCMRSYRSSSVWSQNDSSYVSSVSIGLGTARHSMLGSSSYTWLIMSRNAWFSK